LFASTRMLAVALAALTALAPAPSAAQAPSAQALMARHDSLVGGRAVLEQRESIRIVGVLNIPMAGIEAPFEILKRKPNSYFFRSSLGAMGEMQQGFDGTTAWALAPGQAPMILDGQSRDQIVTQADFYADLHDTTKYAKAETVGETEFEGKRVFEVRITRKSGSEVTEYFDKATGLSAGGVSSADTPMGKMLQTSVYTDYKEFDGLRFASRIVQRNPQYEVILSIQLVEFNRVEPAAVAVPESIKALVKPE
jgi:hypothetical protein